MPSSSHSEEPTSWPWALKNGKHIAPPIRTVSARSRNASSTPILSVTFAPPTTATSGRFGSSRMPLSVVTSRSSSRPAARRQQVRDALGRGVRAVRGAERVVDVDVGELRVALGQRRRRSSSRPRRSARSRPSRRRPSGTSSRSGASVTSTPSSSPSRSAAGLSENFSSTPFGRPRCASRTSPAAPFSRSSFRVGSAAWMRASSVMLRSSSSGTLKSTRTRTRLPSTSRSSSVRTHQHLLGEVHAAVGVAPLVVVPGDDLDQVALEHRRSAASRRSSCAGP